jgi:iron complex outermembrane receptor protein
MCACRARAVRTPTAAAARGIHEERKRGTMAAFLPIDVPMRHHQALCTTLHTLFAIAVVVTAPALAQSTQPPVTDLSLDQLLDAEVPVVVGASRFAQHVTDAPASITIVTREEIERFGYRTMAEILRSVRGFYVTYDRNYTYLGNRGLGRPGDYNTRVLVLVDGHRLNDNVYDGVNIGTEFSIDPEWIERVEIVRGPSSSLYGTSAFFAVVNVVTRQGMDANGLRATTTFGSLRTSRVAGTYGKLFESGTQLLLTASGYASTGQSLIEYPDSGTAARNMDDDEAVKVFGSVGHGPWRVQFSHATRDKLIPTGAYGVAFDDPRSGTTDARGFLDLKFDRRVGGVTLVSRAYYDWYSYEGDYAYGPDVPLFRDATRGRWWGVESMVTRRHGANVLSAGGEYRDNLRQDQNGYDDSDPRVWMLDDRRQSRQWAAFVQDELTISPKLIANAGVRHDRYETFGGTTNPRAALIFKPDPATAVKLLYGKAFRAPNAYESYYYAATPPLSPERIATTELAVERYGANGLRLAATAFHYDIHNLISQTADGALDDLMFVNGVEVSMIGYELEAERVWLGGWQALGSYTFQRPHEGADHHVMSNSPRHLAQARLSGPFVSERLTFGVEGLFTGARFAVDGQRTPAFGVGNLTVRTARPLAGLTLSLHVANVANREYTDPGGEEHPMSLIQQDGRTVAVTASWKF